MMALELQMICGPIEMASQNLLAELRKTIKYTSQDSKCPGRTRGSFLNTSVRNKGYAIALIVYCVGDLTNLCAWFMNDGQYSSRTPNKVLDDLELCLGPWVYPASNRNEYQKH
jgi:hypothetical protein